MNKQPATMTTLKSGGSTAMNNWVGLLVAITLAMVAGVLNWQYLERKTNEIEMISFLAIAEGVTLKEGDVFKDHHFAELNVPFNNSKSLEQSAVYFRDLDTVVGMSVVRPYRSGDVILRQELKAPPLELNLQPGEVVMWVPVSQNTLVSSLITPGDMVSFDVPKPGTMSPFRRPRVLEEVPDQQVAEPTEWNLDGIEEVEIINQGSIETIGPFRVVSVGSRLGSTKVARASGQKMGQSNTLGIAIKRVGKGFDLNSEELRKRVYSPGFKHAGVILHNPQDVKKKK